MDLLVLVWGMNSAGSGLLKTILSLTDTVFLSFVLGLVAVIEPLSLKAQEHPGIPSQSLVPEMRRPFRIAHVRNDEESPFSREILDRLRLELQGTPVLRSAFTAVGLTDIVLQTADSYPNLIDSMNQGIPDLVFCSSVAFVDQGGDYEALFQIRRSWDEFGSGGNAVFHRGLVIVGNRSPLFSEPESEQVLRRVLREGPIGMVGSFSAVGYVTPMLYLQGLFEDPEPIRPPAFLGSSEEVTKAVINGTVELGACDEGVLEEVLRNHGLEGEREKLLKTLAATEPMPTDPVALRGLWRPSGPDGPPRSQVGRQVRDAVRNFFHRQPEMPRMEPGGDHHYEPVRSALSRLRKSAEAREGL